MNSKRDFLTLEEEDELVKLAVTGDVKAKQELVLRYLPLVRNMVRRKCRAGDYEDQVHNGILGLYDAIERFDLTQGTRFGTFASYRVFWKIQEAQEKHRPYSWDPQKADRDPANSYQPTLEGDLIYKEQLTLVHEYLSEQKDKLSESAVNILISRFQQGMTFTEIGEQLGISKQAASQMEKHLIKKIKKAVRRATAPKGEPSEC